jgi:hypothetical protein
MKNFNPLLFDGPIPGESLVSNPHRPMPWERPPLYTNKDKATIFLSKQLMEPSSIHAIAELIRKTFPLEDISKVILYAGFAKGFWNPDLLMLLIEPLMYMLLFIGEQSGLHPILYSEQNRDLSPEEEMQNLQRLATKMESVLPRGLMSKMKVNKNE